MTHDEKLSLILKAINEALEFTSDNEILYLYCSADNGLINLNFNEIRRILLYLQNNEDIFEIKNGDSKSDHFALDINNTFYKWYGDYQIRQKGKVENLSESNFKEVYYLLTQIENQLQLSQMRQFTLSFVTSIHEIQGLDIEDIDNLVNGCIKVLNYLKTIGVIIDYSHGTKSLDADITLSITRFFDVLETAKKVKQAREQVEQTKPTTPVIEKVQATYDPKKGLLNVGTKTVKLNKDSFRAKLIELLLKDEENRKNEWAWDEVIEVIEDTKGKEATKESKNKFYPACDGLTKHIASKIGINDLLIFNKSTVQLNPKYL